MKLSVVIPAHNSRPAHLARTVSGLCAQTLSKGEWELLLVDNRSEPPLTVAALAPAGHPAARVVREDELGLNAARICGFREARGEAVVLVDDDNVLAPNYLVEATRLLDVYPHLGAIGGRSIPEWETSPPPWLAEFPSLLALRDLGPEPVLAMPPPVEFPDCAPLGAGFVTRRKPALAWAKEIESNPLRRTLDRTGSGLSSGGDNDLALTVMEEGWGVGYFPTLSLTHLIPAGRTKIDYLARLQRATARSFVRMLSMHGLCPWSPISPLSLPLRKARAWLRLRPWSNPTARLRWEYAAGQFEARAG